MTASKEEVQPYLLLPQVQLLPLSLEHAAKRRGGVIFCFREQLKGMVAAHRSRHVAHRQLPPGFLRYHPIALPPPKSSAYSLTVRSAPLRLHHSPRHNTLCLHARRLAISGHVCHLATPARLPFQEFVIGMAMKACHVLQFLLLLALVLFVWLLIIPYITFLIWHLTFVRSFGEAQRLFLRHVSAPLILTDCLHGFLLSASIVFFFVGAMSLRDYFRHLLEIGGHDGERDDEGHERCSARAVRRFPGAVNRVHADEGNAEDVGGAQGIDRAG